MTEIFLGKLPRNTVESELRVSLGKYGRIKQVSCQKDSMNPHFKHGFITFETEEATERALAANKQHSIRGQYIYILPKKGEEHVKSSRKSSVQTSTGTGTSPAIVAKKKTVPQKWTCSNEKCKRFNFPDNSKCYFCGWKLSNGHQAEENGGSIDESENHEASERVAQPEASRTLRRPNSVKDDRLSMTNGLEKQANFFGKFDFDAKLDELTDLLKLYHGVHVPRQKVVHCLLKCSPLLEIDLDSYEKKLDGASEFHNTCYKMVQNCDGNTKQAFQFAFDGAAQALMVIVNEINGFKHKAEIRPCLEEISELIKLSGTSKTPPKDEPEVPLNVLVTSVLNGYQLETLGAPRAPSEGIPAVDKLIQGLEQTIFTLKNPGSVPYAPHLCSLAHDAVDSAKQRVGSRVDAKPKENLDDIVVLHRVHSHLNRLGSLVAKCKICEDRCLEYSRTQGEPYKFK